MSQIFNYLTNQTDNMVATLETWVNHDSPTFNKPASDAMGQIIAQAFIETGATKIVHPQPKLGDHYTLTWTYPQRAEQILLLGHFDTVWPDEEAKRRPFSLDNGKALGPGVSDMKAGLLVAYYAMQAIKDLNLQPRKNVVFVLNSDEEIGSPTSRTLIEEEGRRSAACFVMEPARRGCLVTARKGIGRFEMTVTGKAAHSGVDPEEGVSAIEELAHQILALHGMTDLARGLILNVGVIQGGTRPNVTAAQATAEIDLRVANETDARKMTDIIKNLQPKIKGTTLKITGQMNRPSFEESEATLALFEKAVAIADGLGFELDKVSSGGGSDANFVAPFGVPTLDGLGGVGAGSHALHEHTMVADLPKRATLLAELILAA